jgi:hypothetical protein
MAKLYITEYITQPIVTNGQMGGMGLEPCVINAASPITIAGVAASSTAFGTTTKFIRVHTDAICSFRISAAGTAATANDARMAASTTEYFGVLPGHVLSVITNT